MITENESAALNAFLLAKEEKMLITQGLGNRALATRKGVRMADQSNKTAGTVSTVITIEVL